MSDRDFEIAGKQFKLNKIDAFKQFHIARRVAPILGDLLPAMKGYAGAVNDSMSESEKLDQAAAIFAPIMNGLAKLSDADADRVLFGLLSSVEIKHMGGWAKVATDSALMMQDLELPVLLQVAGRAFAYNLSGFFGALPRLS